MPSERWQQINELLDAVLELEPRDREGFITQACAGNQTLRREVESLLIALEQAGSFMEASPAKTVAGLFDNSQPLIGKKIGPYQVLSEIGRGGMGIVYLADRADQSYSKLVAIKLVQPGPNYIEVLQRFRQERQILADLDHPNIARLLDGGTTEYGLPYVIMEHVAGIPITGYCDKHKLSITERLKLFRTVCSAVQFAHQNLIIHRDLKPTNILVTDDGTIKLLDFGIAKLLKPDLYPAGSDLTHTGSHLMTPEYASPEQVRGAPVTTASDVYSLGVLLYELMTGHHPYRLKSHSLSDLEAAICDREPERPSVIISQVAEPRPDGTAHTKRTPQNVSLTREGKPEKLRARLRGDIDNIVLMALRKGAPQRYQSAEQLSQDIRRHLEGQTVTAQRITLAYRAEKFIRRHKVGMVIAAVFIMTLIGGIIATMWQARIAKREATNNRWLLYAAQMNLAGQAWDSVNLERVQELVESNRPGPGEQDLRGFEWYYLWRLCHSGSDYMTMRHEGVVWSVAFSPDGKRIVSGSDDQTAKVWDAATGQELLTLAGHTKWVNGVTFSPDGRQLATVSGDTTAKLWDAITGKQHASFKGHTARVNAAVFSHDGKRLFTGSDDLSVKIWDTATGRELVTFKDRAWVRALALSPDGNRLSIAGSIDVKLLDANTGKQLLWLKGHTDHVVSLKFSRDGKTLASASYDGTAKLWEASTGRELFTLKGHNNRVSGVDFSPDGRKVVTSSDDRTIRLWDVTTGQELASLRGHLRQVESVVFSPDGQRLASAGMDQTVRLWDFASGQKSPDIITGLTHHIRNMAYRQNGSILAVGQASGIILLDTVSGRILSNVDTSVFVTAISPDGRIFATGNDTGTVKVWDAYSGKELTTLKGRHTGPVLVMAYSPDSKILVTGGFDSTVKLWDAATNQEIASFNAHEGRVLSVAFSPDGKTLATSGQDQMVKLWDVASIRELAALDGHSYWVNSVAFSPDGRKLASGSGDLTVKLWEVASGRELITFKGHANDITSVAFSHDGKRLATGSNDYTVRLWDVATGQELICLKGHKDFVSSVVFSADDKTLASGGRDHTVRLWRAATEEEVSAQSKK